MKLLSILSGLNKGWAVFIVIVAASGIGGGAYAAWTANLHVEGTIQTGDVDIVWDMQSDREFVGILDPATGQLVNSPLPPEKDVSDCVSSLQPGTVDGTVSFRVINAFPSYTCEITLGALISGSVPVHVSEIRQEFVDADGNPVLDTEINLNIDLTRKVEIDQGVFICDPDQPINEGTQLHNGDRFCAVITVHATEAAPQSQNYSGALWIDVIQWNLSGDVVIPPNNPPVAADDNFDALGNTQLVVGAAMPATPATQVTGSLLDNDTDTDGDPLATVPFVGTTANGGFVNLGAVGRFTYQPPVAFNGQDTFPYSVADGNGGEDSGLVTIIVTNMVWYVDSGAAAGGNGTSSSPFNSLSPLTLGGIFDALDGAGDIIFVHEGTGPTGGGIALEPNQQLIGQGFGLSISPFLPSPIVPAAGSPTILSLSGDGIELAANNTVRGLNVRAAAGNGIVGTSVGTLTIGDVPLVDATGGSGISISGAASAAVTIDSVVVNNLAGDGINLTNAPGAFSFTDARITNSNGTGFHASNSGSVQVGPSATSSFISTTNGTALNVANSDIGVGGLTFQSVSSSNAPAGIVLDTTGGLGGGLNITGNVVPGSGGTIQNIQGDAVSLIDTELISMNLVNISSPTGNGINGSLVNSFEADGLELTNIGNADGEHGITFDNIVGNVSIQRTNITNAADHNLRIANTSGILSSLVVADSIFTGGFASTHGGSGVFVDLSSSAEITSLQIGGSTPATDDSDNMQLLDMDGFGIDLRGGANGGKFTSAVIDDVQVLRANAGGVLLTTNATAAGTGDGTFSLTNSEIEGDNSAAIGVGADGNSKAVVTIRNNTARVINRPVFGFGVSVIGARADGNNTSDIPTLEVTIDGNSISGSDAFGINLASRGSRGSLDAKIVNNTIFDVQDDGIRIRSGNGTMGETDTVSVYLEGNDATTDVLGDGYDLRDQSSATTFEIGCDGAAHTECAALVAGPGAVDDQGVIALHGNLGTVAFLGINDPPLYKIIDRTVINAP